MSLQTAQIPTVLGSALDDFWLPAALARRSVSCATLLRHPQEAMRCRAGEVAVLARDLSALGAIEETIIVAAGHHAAAVLVPDAPFLPEEHARLRSLAERHELAVGLLGTHVDPGLAANTLSRALAAAQDDAGRTPLTGAGSLQELAEMLGRLIGNSVTIESPQHELLAFSATEGPVDRVREETILRRRGETGALAWVVRHGYFKQVCDTDHPVQIPANSELGFSGRLAMRVSANGEMLAAIWATDTARPLTSDDEELLVQASEAAAGMLLRRRETAQREAQLRAEMLEDVVRGRISNPESIRALASSLGWDVDRRQQAMVVEIDSFEDLRLRFAEQSHRLQRVRERLTELVRLETLAVDSDGIVGLRSTGVIALFSAGSGDADRRKAIALRLAEAVVQRVASMTPTMTVSVGIGRESTALDHAAESVRQAELAARLGSSLWGGNRAIHYSDLGIHRALFALQEHEEMVTPALQRLIEHDRAHGTSYVQTLSVYLACMGRLRVAAEQLTIHRNTLEYRMQRIERVAGVSLEDPNNRLALELGIRLLEMKASTRSLTD